MTETGKAPDILVIGVGGAGNTIIDAVWTTRFPQVKTVAADTDKQDLDSTHADLKILLGNDLIKRSGKENPDESANAVTEARSEIERLFKPETIVFVVAGIGGGAGSVAAPQVAKIAREKGALVIAIIFLPFQIHKTWINQGKDSLQQLISFADSVIVIDNDRFRSLNNNESPSGVYAKVDEIILGVLKGLITAVIIPCLINCDLDDFQAIFKNRGLSIVLHGESANNVVNTNESVVRNCLNCPSLNVDYRGAQGCFVLITGGNDLNLYDTEEIATSLTYDISLHADVVWSANIEKSMDGRVCVYAIMTGIR
jgi:cell division protein FtsZ